MNKKKRFEMSEFQLSFFCAMTDVKSLIAAYRDPSSEGGLGGVERFARAHNVSLARARRVLEGVLSYTLHRPTRKRFGTLPVLVFGVDEQWVADGASNGVSMA